MHARSAPGCASRPASDRDSAAPGSRSSSSGYRPRAPSPSETGWPAWAARLLAAAHVDLDFLGREQTIVVRVGGLEVLEERVDELLQANPPVDPVRDALERFGGRLTELRDHEIAVLVLVAEEEGLDRRLVELFAVDLAVAVPVVLLDPCLRVQRRARLGQRRAVEQEQTQRRRGGQMSDHGTHHMPPWSGQPWTFQLPSGWRQAVP